MSTIVFQALSVAHVTLKSLVPFGKAETLIVHSQSVGVASLYQLVCHAQIGVTAIRSSPESTETVGG
jgi:hypothetical protein